jgi:Flp pilus assembly protein TadD
MRVGLVVCALALVVAGCGGTSMQTGASSTSKPKPVATTARCRRATARWTKRLGRDVAAIRRAARLRTNDTLKGNAAVNAATDRFMLDVAKAPVDLLVKNRFIDHAAAALVGSCEQCFQALEANRPIPAIGHSGRCGG